MANGTARQVPVQLRGNACAVICVEVLPVAQKAFLWNNVKWVKIQQPAIHLLFNVRPDHICRGAKLQPHPRGSHSWLFSHGPFLPDCICLLAWQSSAVKDAGICRQHSDCANAEQTGTFWSVLCVCLRYKILS